MATYGRGMNEHNLQQIPVEAVQPGDVLLIELEDDTETLLRVDLKKMSFGESKGMTWTFAAKPVDGVRDAVVYPAGSYVCRVVGRAA